MNINVYNNIVGFGNIDKFHYQCICIYDGWIMKCSSSKSGWWYVDRKQHCKYSKYWNEISSVQKSVDNFFFEYLILISDNDKVDDVCQQNTRIQVPRNRI